MTATDWGALALFFLCWLGYEPLLSLLARRSGSLNADMLRVRQAWMRAMTHREMRLIDSQLMGHSINSASFFASANLLLIAAVAGVLFGGEQALQGVAQVGTETNSLKILEAKLALVLITLARGLLDFIWSIRQMNYTLTIFGAAPEGAPDEKTGLRDAVAQAGARVLNGALTAFNAGVRGYYFALAAAAWMFGPIPFVLATVGAVSLLAWRQTYSPTAGAVRALREALDESGED